MVSACKCGQAGHRAWCPEATLVWTVVEFWGNGDPMVGGAAKDLCLGPDGKFGYQWGGTPTFKTREAAMAAGEAAPNRRVGGLVSAMKWSADPITGKRY